ncbi:MAG: hypothetical protein J6C46_05575 [Clostridia bacterium]|nr:hypothetical protein [Clostridia bacterium]
MAVTEKEFYERFFLAYKRKDLVFLKDNLDNLPDNIKFDILTLAMQDDEYSLLTEENLEFLANNLHLLNGVKKLELICTAFLRGTEQLLSAKNLVFLNNNWRRLGGNERLEIIEKASKSGNFMFCGEKHFIDWEDDLALIEQVICRIKEKFSLSDEMCNKIIQGFPKSKKGRYIRETVELYCRLKDYEELFDKHGITDKLKKEFEKSAANNGKNRFNYCDIFNCDPRRTKARIELLFDINGKEAPNDIYFLEDLRIPKEEFGVIYQKEILDKLYEWKSKDKEAYYIIREYCLTKPGLTFFNFLEFGLSAAYNDTGLKKYIEKRRSLDKPEKVETKLDYTLEDIYNFVNEGKVKSSKPERIRNISDESVLPVDSTYGGYTRLGGLEDLGNPKITTSEGLNEKRIGEFIELLMGKGFKCEGYVEAKSGVPCSGELYVRLYFLEKDGVKILEPIGQLGNRTLVILDRGKTTEEIIDVLKKNTVKDLWGQGFLDRRNHKWADNSYNYDFTEKLLDDIVKKEKNKELLSQEPKKRGRNRKNLADINEELVKTTPREDIPAVLKYVKDIGEKTEVDLLELSANHEAEQAELAEGFNQTYEKDEHDTEENSSQDAPEEGDDR